MSGHQGSPREAFAARLAPWLAPRSDEAGGSGSLHLAETIALALAGLLLAVATVNDVVRQSNVNHRLAADLRTWRAYTGHSYRNLSIGQDYRTLSTREVICGNTSPGAPGARVQICLTLSGPVSRGRRRVAGGWYLPPRVADLGANRYDCFGAARAEARCPR